MLDESWKKPVGVSLAGKTRYPSGPCLIATILNFISLLGGSFTLDLQAEGGNDFYRAT
jgi:hypothetical protein